MNIAKSIPRDANGVPIKVPIAPPVVALEETYDATISASTAITLNTATTIIEVTAIDKAIFMKWGGTAASTDYDHCIPANSTRYFLVPASITTVEFIEESATAKLSVAEF